MSVIYLDTSALAKKYLQESHTEDFLAWEKTHSELHISQLTVVEFRCLLARRERRRELTKQEVEQIFSLFNVELSQNAFILHTISENSVIKAIDLIEQLTTVPLRTLDAIHLSIALDICAVGLATADIVMAEAGQLLSLEIFRFD